MNQPSFCINNLPAIVSATPLQYGKNDCAERFVICSLPDREMPFGVYKEMLKWKDTSFQWEHVMFFGPTQRSDYSGAMANLQFRSKGIHIFENEKSNQTSSS